MILIKIVSLVKRGIMKPVIFIRFGLDEAIEALRRLKDDKILGRGVINP